MPRRWPEPLDYRCGWPNDLPPWRAGDLAFTRFCTPKLSERRSADHDILAERARFHLRNATWLTVPTAQGPVPVYLFDPEQGREPRGAVLIAHGWTSEASFMAVFAEQLRRAGFRVVAFDQPGHGYNPRTRASLMDCSRALLEVAEAMGPIRFIVAHSMGCLASLLTGSGEAPMPRAYPFERYVLISGPNEFATVTQEYGETLGLSPAAQRHYETRLERIAYRKLADFTGVNFLTATERPALLIHARDDAEVAFENSEQIAASCPRARLLPVDGLGHRNILFAPPVIRATLSYLTSD